MKSNTIIFLAIGERYALQAVYAIISLLKVYNMRIPLNWEVVVFTDSVEPFDIFPLDIPLRLRIINDDDIQHLIGENKHVYRAKIKVLQNLNRSLQQNVLFVDTDIIFYKRIDKIFKWIEEGHYILHEKEDLLYTRPFKSYTDTFARKSFKLSSSRDININEQSMMWNSGVIGLRSSNIKVLDDVLELNDCMYSIAKLRLVEQLAFSLVFCANQEPKESRNMIFHYCWEEGKAIIEQQVEFVLHSRKDLQEALNYFDQNKIYLLSLKDKAIYFSNPSNFLSMLKRKLNFRTKSVTKE